MIQNGNISKQIKHMIPCYVYKLYVSWFGECY